MSKSDNPGARVYVGDLGSGGSKPELEKEFERFGPLKSVWVARNPPGELIAWYTAFVLPRWLSFFYRVCLVEFEDIAFVLTLLTSLFFYRVCLC